MAGNAQAQWREQPRQHGKHTVRELSWEDDVAVSDALLLSLVEVSSMIALAFWHVDHPRRQPWMRTSVEVIRSRHNDLRVLRRRRRERSQSSQCRCGTPPPGRRCGHGILNVVKAGEHAAQGGPKLAPVHHLGLGLSSR